MAWVGELSRKTAMLMRKKQLSAELEEEMRLHIEIRTEEERSNGKTQTVACSEARKRFGNATVLKEESYMAWGWSWLEHLIQDFRFALRTMLRHPTFAIIAILILALGIGSNTAIFSLMYGILLRPLPFPHSDRIYAAWAEQQRENLNHISMSGPDLADIENQSPSFEHVVGMLPYFTYTMTGEGEPQIVKCTAFSPGFFQLFGVQPILGRAYRTDEYDTDGQWVILSYEFWQRQFHGDKNIIGHVIHLQNRAMTIIGVMPSLPDIYPETDIWAKLVPHFQFMQWRANKFITVYGELKPGVSPAQAEQELTALLRRAPETSKDTKVYLVPLKEELVGRARPILVVLTSAVVLVLLIVCVNVAILLLVRNETRKREVALRIALGSSRARLLRQWLTESLVLSSLGCVLGIIFAFFAMRILLWLGSNQLPRSEHIGTNFWVLGFAFLLTLFTSVVCGLSPATSLSRNDLDASLRSGRGDVGTLRRSRWNALIASEVALSLLLLVGSGDLLRSFWKLLHSDLGFSPDHLVTTSLRIPGEPGRTVGPTQHQVNFYRSLLPDVSELPGVTAVGVSDCFPGLGAATDTISFADRPADPNHAPTSLGCWTSPGYFRAVGIPLLRGRFFDEHDGSDSPPVVIVDDAFVRRYWPNENPLGKRISVAYMGPGRRIDVQPRVREVVGVVANVKERGLNMAVEPGVYMPFYQDETGHVLSAMDLYVRSNGDPEALASSLRSRIRVSQPDLPLTIRRVDEILMQSVAPQRFTLVLLCSFAIIALLLAASGIYGVVAFSVSRRTQEIGVRMALGATRGQVLLMILTEILVPLALGFVLGGVATVPSSRVISNMLFASGSLNSVILLAACGLMLLIAFLAAILPAYRAASTDPVGALRME